jgi:hypothetical protein
MDAGVSRDGGTTSTCGVSGDAAVDTPGGDGGMSVPETPMGTPRVYDYVSSQFAITSFTVSDVTFP